MMKSADIITMSLNWVRKTVTWKKVAASIYIADNFYPLFRLDLVLAVLSFEVGILTTLFEGAPKWGWTLFMVVSAFELFKLYKGLYSKLEIEFDFSEVFTKTIRPQFKSGHVYDHGYGLMELQNGDVIFRSDLVDQYLISQPVVVLKAIPNIEKKILRTREYFFPILCAYLGWKIRRKNHGILENDAKVALLTDLEPATGSIEVAQTHYFTTQVTNDAATYQMVEGGKVLVDLTHMYPLSETGQFQQLSRSTLSNHIGVGTLCMDSHGYLLVAQQGEAAQRSEGLWAPSGSGSVDWSDFDRLAAPKTLIDLLRVASLRELREELCIDDENWRVGSQNLVLGYFQWLKVGGLPQFLSISRISLSHKVLEPERKEIKRIKPMSDSPTRSSAEVIKVCDTWLSTHAQELSTPLNVLLLQVKRILEGKLGNEARIRLVNFWTLNP